jgi:two-component system chemotaxis response regulator CheB
MSKIRLLVVDDSSLMRRALVQFLSQDSELEVVATAANGRIALNQLEAHEVDAILLDVEMPELNGLETLQEIRDRGLVLPVIMFSTLTRPGVRTTIDSLLIGATDYVMKPDRREAVESSIRDTLIPKIKQHVAAFRDQLAPAPCTAGSQHWESPNLQSQSLASGALEHRNQTQHRGVATEQIELVVIASSTGGPNALMQVFTRLPHSLSAPILIVQHMPPIFTQQLAYRLSAKGNLVTREAQHCQLSIPGEVRIAPGDYHMAVRRTIHGCQTILNQDPHEHSCRPAADVLFRSAAEAYGPGVLAVVLTGMGRDGLIGARAIHEAGGQVIVQDKESCTVWGMPGAVADAGLAEGIYPLEDIPYEIATRVGRCNLKRTPK